MLSTPLPETASSEPTHKNEDFSNYRSTTINEQTYLSNKPDQFPISVNKYILSNDIDCNFKNSTVCIAVQCTNICDKILENVKICEIVPEDMSIINCSSPVVASNIDEIIRFERKGANLFCAKDI